MTSDVLIYLVSNVETCIKSIKIKNCEGYDRIPQRILADGAELLLEPLSKLFEFVYSLKRIPEQWRISNNSEDL